MTALISIPWLGTNLILLLAALRLSTRAYPGDDPFQRLLHVSVIYVAGITASATILGAAGGLTGLNLLLLGTAISGVILWSCRRGDPFVPRLGRPGAATRSSGTSWPFVAWAVVLSAWAADLAVRGFGRFVTSFDTVMYHIPLIDYWLQARSLYIPDSFHWSNPGGNEIVGLWMVAPFSSDFLIPLNNVPSLLILAFGALELGRAVGLDRFLAHLVALAVISHSVASNQFVEASNDLAVAGFFLACLAYGFRYARDGRRPDLALFAATIGLTGGVKYFALGYAAVAWAAIALLVSARRGWRAGLETAAVGLLGAFLLGGYWYVRNAVVSGSPFFPLGISSSNDLLAKSYPHAWRSSMIGNGRAEIWPLILHAIRTKAGPCHLAAVMALPVTLTILVVAGARRFRRTEGEQGLECLVLAAVVVGSGFIFAITPFCLEDRPGTLNHLLWAYTPVRYGLSFLSVAVIGLALALQTVCGPRSVAAGTVRRRRLALVPLVLLGGLTFMQLAGTIWEIPYNADRSESYSAALIFVDLLVALAVARIVWMNAPKARHVLIPVLGMTLAAATVLGLERLAVSWDEQFDRSYDVFFGSSVFRTLSSDMTGPGRVCVLDYRCHPFFGPRRQRRVCQPMTVPSYSWLLGYLRDRGVEVVAVRTTEPGEPAGWDAYVGLGPWFQDHGRDFQQVHRDLQYTLYRLRHHPLSPPGSPAIVGRGRDRIH